MKKRILSALLAVCVLASALSTPVWALEAQQAAADSYAVEQADSEAEPTEAPAEEPTQAPAEEPTEAPTAEPTEAPTEEPTEAPTAEPTQAPTEEPTQAPTAEPTQAPTEEPTEAPTPEPTEAPAETGETAETPEAAEDAVAVLSVTLTEPSEGDGTEGNPYQIGSAEELYWFAQQVNNGNGGIHAKLTQDITVNKNVLDEDGGLKNGEGENFTGWTPIGAWGKPYTGSFNGNNHTISGLYCNSSDSYVGLFGYSQGTIQNVTVADSYFVGGNYVGGVCGCNSNSITNCTNSGTVTGNSAGVGGVCGENSGSITNCANSGTVTGSKENVGGVCGAIPASSSTSSISDCTNSGTVTGSGYVGGVCGRKDNGTLANCANSGNVESTGNYVGGVCGCNSNTITNCTNSGSVNGDLCVGGVCGFSNGTLTNCTNTNSVVGSDSNVGGVCGENYSGTLTNCANGGSVTGSSYVGGVCGRNSGPLTNCANSGSVESTGECVGGVCGSNNNILTNCANSGSVNGGNYVGGLCGFNSQTIKNCYYNSTVYKGGNVVGYDNKGTTPHTAGKTTEEFASGEVAYLLNGSVDENGEWTEGEASATPAWYQNLDNSKEKDACPVLDNTHGTVHKVECYLCPASQQPDGYSYSNGTEPIHVATHSYENGFCKYCNAYEEPSGEGNEGSPYQIANAGNLYWFAAEVNGGRTSIHAKLMNNITVNENVLDTIEAVASDKTKLRVWSPIGKDDQNYKGTFDGGNHTISGLYCDSSGTNYVGLFGYNKGTIQNVTVADSYLNGNQYVGGVCGRNINGSITGCTNSSTVTGTNNNVGGVCGLNQGSLTSCVNSGTVTGSNNYVGGVCGENDSTITDCTNGGSVNGSSCVGGVCGWNDEGTLTLCTNGGAVSGGNTVGGVCGDNESTITDCTNTGSVTGSAYVGGVCGKNCTNDTSISAIITSCTSTGTVIGTGSSQYVGGMCGWNDTSSTITNCYYDTTVYQSEIAIGNNLGTITHTVGKPTTEFQTGEVTWLLNGSWDGDTFTPGKTDSSQAWYQTIGTDTYPVLDNSHGTVYQNGLYHCKGETTPFEISYSNEDTSAVRPDHTYEQGICQYCQAYQEPTAGDGSKDSPYEIGNVGQLYWFAALVNGTEEQAAVQSACAKLTANITVNTEVLGEGGALNEASAESFSKWTPMGSDTTPYTGTFDGGGFTISGLYFNQTGTSYVGLFGYNKGIIQNVTVADSYFGGYDYVGGLCGYNNGGTLTDCASSSTVTGSNNYVGGVCGYNGGTLTNCTNNGTVSGTVSGSSRYVGGVCGNNYYGTLSGCTNTGAISGIQVVGGVCGGSNNTLTGCTNSGTVTGSYFYIGGVCGYNISSGTITACGNSGTVEGNGQQVGGVCGRNGANCSITNCYSSGSVTGNKIVGGVCGQNYADTSIITNCYSSGSVTGNEIMGGVCGQNYADTSIITNCYYDSSRCTSGGIAGTDAEGSAEGKTTDQFKSGEVTWLLNGSSNDSTKPWLWYQTLGEGNNADDYPVLDNSHDSVYQNIRYHCVGETAPYETSYSNQKEETVKPDHPYDNGICPYCGVYQVPEGNGSEGSPYEIGNEGQLYWFAALVNGTEVKGTEPQEAVPNACAKLTANITVNTKVLGEGGALNEASAAFFSKWTPMGSEANPYTGTFDGNGKTISGLYCESSTTDYVGLFWLQQRHHPKGHRGRFLLQWQPVCGRPVRV